jgi:hypothetical protein
MKTLAWIKFREKELELPAAEKSQLSVGCRQRPALM